MKHFALIMAILLITNAVIWFFAITYPGGIALFVRDVIRGKRQKFLWQD